MDRALLSPLETEPSPPPSMRPSVTGPGEQDRAAIRPIDRQRSRRAGRGAVCSRKQLTRLGNSGPHTSAHGKRAPRACQLAPCPRLSHTHALQHVPPKQRRFTTQRSDQTPVPGSALHPHPRGVSATSLPSRQTLVQELPQTHLPEQPAAVYSSPAVVSRLVQLPVQLCAHVHVSEPTAPLPAL